MKRKRRKKEEEEQEKEKGTDLGEDFDSVDT